MAFSFTYKEIFNRAAVSRTWLDSSSRDKALRYSTILGFILAYGIGALVAGEFPPDKDLLAPFVYVGGFELLPAVAMFPIVFYVAAWVADEFPFHSRLVIIVAGVAGLLAYAIGTLAYVPGSYATRIGFFSYPVAIAILAFVQMIQIRSDLRGHED